MSTPFLAPRLSRHRSRRLRKKLRVGEFKVVGFHVEFGVEKGIGEDGVGTLMEQFVAAVVENGLVCGGGYDGTSFGFFVLGPGQSSASPEARQALRTWLEAQKPSIRDIRVGAMHDAHYDEPLSFRET